MTEQLIITPSSPEDRKKIKGVIEAMSNAMTRIEGEREYIKEAKKALKDDFNLPMKEITTMLNDFHKQEFDSRVQRFEEYTDLYESVMKSSEDNVDEDGDDLEE
tara:strand:- start:47838 stop:48149 length:312 start_codon:yes stop_codon:yes gene_type:complete